MSWGRWQQGRQSELEKLQRWLLAAIAAILLQVPLFMGILHIIERSVSDIEFHSVAKGPVAVLEPEPPQEKPAAAEPETAILEHEEKPVEPPDEVPKGTEVPVGQIVSVVPIEKEETPDRARFSARSANKVAQEMKARMPSESQKIPQKYSKQAVPESRPAPMKGELAAKQKESAAVNPGSKAAEAEEGTLVREGAKTAKGMPDRAFDGLALPASLAGMDPVAKYSPSAAPFASDDYIADVEEEGETNLLNTIPYRYAGFFERVKERVRIHWDPNRVYRTRDPTGDLYGHKDRFTILSIVLDENGHVLDTSVTGPSGLKFLDDEAGRAFWAAGPFPNPPKGLVEEDGRIRFDFGFGFLIASSRHKFFWRWQ